MIWFTLALFAVSFLAVALLAPKPNIENARKEELDPESFPRATEDAPIPLVLGTVRLRAPNTIWYGDYKADPISEKVKTGLFSSRRVTVGYRYRLGIDLALCLGPAILKKIFWDGKEVFSGSIGESGTGDISSGAADDFVVNLNNIGGGPRSLYTTASLGIPDASIDAGLVTYRHEFTVVHVGGTTFVLTAQVWGEFRNAALATISSYSGNGNNGLATKTSTVVETGTIPAGTRRIDIVGNVAFAGFGGALNVTFKNFEANGPLPVASQNFLISAPELFGGHKRGGGIQGDGTFYPGSFVQTADTYVEGFVGAGNLPAYRGTSHLVLKDFYIGESPNLRMVEFEIESVTLGATTATVKIGAELNPSEALYEILTDDWRGLGIDPSRINLASFESAAATLLSESNGCSLIVTSPAAARTTITEILRQVDGILRENTAGEIEFFLIRRDYDASLLPVFDEDDIIEITSYTKTSWEDVSSEVKVSFSSREKESTRIAVAQNMAIANMLDRRRTSEISFPFCYDAALANRLAARELSTISVPLYRMTVVMNRNAYNLRVGSVIKISWPEYGIVEIIMRVQKPNFGQIDDNKIIFELVQDKFAIGTAVFATPEDSGWTDPNVPPADVTSVVAEMPYFYSSVLENPIPDGFGSIIVFPTKPQTQSVAYSVFKGISSTDVTNNDISEVDYPFSGLLTAQILSTDGFATGILSSFTVGTLVGSTPIDVTTAQVRDGELGIIYINGEWMAYEEFTDNGGGTYTFGNVYRGLFGTQPLTHVLGTRMFIFSIDQLESGAFGTELLDDAIAYFKVCDSVSTASRDPSSVTASTTTLQSIADRPLRPRNLQMDSTRSIPFVATGIHALSWVSSNRAEAQVVFEQDAADTPDQTEEYDLEVWIDGVEDVTLSQTNVTSPHNINFTGKTGATCEVRLYSRRSAGATSFYYAFFPVVFSITADSTSITVDNSNITVDQA